MGMDVSLRTALGATGAAASPASSGVACFRTLRHEFLAVAAGPGSDYEGVEYLVEPAFREQFEIPCPSPMYRELLDAVPAVFVGVASQLVPAVQVRGAGWRGGVEGPGVEAGGAGRGVGWLRGGGGGDAMCMVSGRR